MPTRLTWQTLSEAGQRVLLPFGRWVVYILLASALLAAFLLRAYKGIQPINSLQRTALQYSIQFYTHGLGNIAFASGFLGILFLPFWEKVGIVICLVIVASLTVV